MCVCGGHSKTNLASKQYINNNKYTFAFDKAKQIKTQNTMQTNKQ